jgi:hypothetical protein
MDTLAFHGKEGVTGSSPVEGLALECRDLVRAPLAPSARTNPRRTPEPLATSARAGRIATAAGVRSAASTSSSNSGVVTREGGDAVLELRGAAG